MDHMHLSDFYSEGKERKIRIAVKKREYRNATLNIDGYKHSMVQIIALAVALKIKIVINNPPLVSDTLVFIEIINHLGGHAELNDGKLYINAQSINKYSIPEFLGRCIHGSLYLCPALLTAIGYFEYFGSGGCQIGNSEDLNERPIKHALSVISKFGHEVIFKEDRILGIRKSVDNLSSIDIMEYSTSQDGLSGPLVGGATDDDKGTSVIITNSNKGESLLSQIKERIHCQKIPMESIYETNPRFNTPIERNPMSESFFADLQKDEFSMVVKKYINSDDPLSDILKKIVSPTNELTCAFR